MNSIELIDYLVDWLLMKLFDCSYSIVCSLVDLYLFVELIDFFPECKGWNLDLVQVSAFTYTIFAWVQVSPFTYTTVYAEK